MTEAELIQNIILILAGIFGTAIAGIFVYHYKKKADCFTALKNTAYRSEEDIELIKNLIIAMAEIIDDQTSHLHPGEKQTKLQALAEQLLNKNFINNFS